MQIIYGAPDFAGFALWVLRVYGFKLLTCCGFVGLIAPDMETNKRRAEIARENGKNGGRPSKLRAMADGKGGYAGEFSKGGMRRGWEDPAPHYLGAGWWLWEHAEGLRWLVPMGDKPGAGEWAGSPVPKGRNIQDALRMVGAAKQATLSTMPDFGKLENGHGDWYFPRHLQKGDVHQTVAAVRANQSKEREEWERAGWSLPKEKTRGDALEIAEIVGLECGETWGLIARAWVKRNRQHPALWGEGRRVWIKERLRREAADTLEGFEV